ncbi:ABC transporter permease [Methanofollis fontis]|uniref:ABC transporter permease n=1 Tax=Methanofollis fontis TaxID=2052832 RepID=A0A483CYD0_9EURY|nr:ABC transporter permease [Methanofollis fontis]TAJ44626.1 ABC transporter permease [Methanofollis fontis]
MRNYLKIILPIIILFGWEAVAIALNNPFILPPIEDVLAVLLEPTKNILGSGSLLEGAERSLFRVLLGFLVASAVAIPLGIVMGRYSIVQDLTDPVIQLLRPIPPLAWLPIALAWFKIGLTSIVFIIFIGAFFPILLNTIAGVKSVNRTWLETATVYGASEGQIMAKVVLPAAAPTIWTGLRVGLGIAWQCVVAAEMLPGTTSGLGYMIMAAYNLGQMQVIIAGMIVIGLIALALDSLFRVVEQRQFRWQGRAH